MTVLVTGGAGFIGSNFIYHLLGSGRGLKVVCLDKLSYAGNISSLAPLMGRADFAFCRGDICDRAAVFALFERYRPDYVINFAAESHVDRSLEDASPFLNTNIIGTQVLMEACLHFGVRRFHQVSTDEVYGDLPLEGDESFREGSALKPSSPYSASKASADLLVMAYRRSHGLPASISRCSNNYGVRQFPEKLIPLMISRALHDEPMPVYGDGRNVRDWLYVDDHCRALELILFSDCEGELFNIGGGRQLSNIELVRLICKTLGKSEKLIRFVPDRKGHDLRYAIDNSYIKSRLGWQPQTDFEEGISNTLNWYLDNRDWWEAILSGSYLELNGKY